ncbi:MAG: GNAT family protein [Pseudomonadota bacterium]
MLRHLCREDAAALYAIHSDPAATRYWSSAPWREAAQANAYLDTTLSGYADGSRLCLGVALRAGGELLGTCTLYAFNPQNRRCDIGYMLAPAHWGNGYMQEALPALIAHGFDTLDLHRIEADIDPRNTASARLLERMHFLHEGRLRERWIIAGEICDTDLFGLLRKDWRAARA